MKNFTKVYRVGTAKTWGGRSYSVFVEAEYKEGCLSLCGVEGPTQGGNALGSCGQITLDPEALTPAPGWTRGNIARLSAIWGEYHLNGMHAGTPKQEAALKTWIAEGNAYDYQMVCAVLEDQGLLVDDGYKYGSAWLKTEVPEAILQELIAFPDTDRKPAWV